MESSVRRRAMVSARASRRGAGAAAAADEGGAGVGVVCARTGAHATDSKATSRTATRARTARSGIVELVSLLRADVGPLAFFRVDDGEQLDGLAGPAVERLSRALHDPDLVPVLELEDEFRILGVHVLLAELAWGSRHAAKLRTPKGGRNGAAVRR